MGRRNEAIDLSFISRRMLKTAMEHVRTKGGRAPGPDRMSHHAAFGRGPGSPEYRQIYRRLRRDRSAYRLGPTRLVVRRDLTGKKRELEIPSFADRIVLTAVNMMVQLHLQQSQVAVCRPGIDARFSVVAMGLAVRTTASYVARTDIRKAFPSLRYERVLASPQGRRLPAHLRSTLGAIYRYYSPAGVGVPMGLPTSPGLLELACQEFDRELDRRFSVAYRYVDDVVVAGNNPAIADRLVSLMQRHLDVFGLQAHPEKTSLHCRLRSWGFGPTFPVQWLGHEIDADGMIDICEGVSDRILRKDHEGAIATLRHFILAGRGQRFLTTANNAGIDLRSIPGWGEEVPPQAYFNSAYTPGRGEVPKGTNHVEGDGVVEGVATSSNTTTGHPHTTPDQGLSDAALVTTDEQSGGDCRGRQAKESCRPRRSRNLRHLGGQFGLLKAAYDWHSTNTNYRAMANEEARILLGSPVDKAEQLARAYEVWQQARAVIETKIGYLPDRFDQKVVPRVWQVLLAAGTLTINATFRTCFVDPVVLVLDVLAGGMSTREAKRQLSKERQMRQEGDTPRLLTTYGKLVGRDELFEKVPTMAAPATVRQRSARWRSNANKRRGMEAEARIATDLLGRTVPGSGAGFEKGDVVGSGARVEVKSTRGGRWRVPIAQIKQVERAASDHDEVPAVVLSADQEPVLATIRLDLVRPLIDEIFQERTLRPRQQSITVSRKDARIVGSSDIAKAVLVKDDDITWAICDYSLFKRILPLRKSPTPRTRKRPSSRCAVQNSG